MTSRLSNLALLASWLVLHGSTFRWLGRAWLRDEGQLTSEEFQRAVESIAGRVSGPETGPENKNARL